MEDAAAAADEALDRAAEDATPATEEARDATAEVLMCLLEVDP
tara:strand:- start:12370 stop:12498 length:129 start_codon:yes stop_codon:yes gene_type:complete